MDYPATIDPEEMEDIVKEWKLAGMRVFEGLLILVCVAEGESKYWDAVYGKRKDGTWWKVEPKIGAYLWVVHDPEEYEHPAGKYTATAFRDYLLKQMEQASKRGYVRDDEWGTLIPGAFEKLTKDRMDTSINRARSDILSAMKRHANELLTD